jgi:hypothetical protein
MPIRSRYQGGAYSPVQHHEVVAGQGRAVARERGGGCAERRDPHHGVCRRDVVTGGVVRDRPACTHVVVQQFVQVLAPAGASVQCPASWLCRSAANAAGESKRGRHSQSTDPAMLTRAAVWRSPSKA